MASVGLGESYKNKFSVILTAGGYDVAQEHLDHADFFEAAEDFVFDSAVVGVE